MYASGHDNLFSKRLKLLKGRSVGVIVNQTSIDRKLVHMIDRILDLRETRLVAVFGPQHGLFGQTQDNMIEWHSYRDRKLNLPVFSLYGKTRIPTRAMLKGIDTLIFDIQDAGSRYYTFMSTLYYCLEQCGKFGIELIVCDRPNPISAASVEGNPILPDHLSFVGIAPIPPRYGLTAGELGTFFNREFNLNCKLTVVPMSGYRRSYYFDELDTIWVLPSPNLPTVDSAVVYPGMCLIEGTNVSEGRGTTRPFELFGAPFVNGSEFVAALEKLHLPGCHFRMAAFQPTFQKWQGKLCQGAQIHVTDRKKFKPYLTALGIIKSFIDLYPHQFQWKLPPYEYETNKLPIDILLGNSNIRKMLEDKVPLSKIESTWQVDLRRFLKRRSNYFLYS